MKVIIAGSRTIKYYALVEKAIIDSGYAVGEIICGGAAGVDASGYAYAQAHALPCTIVVPRWAEHGRSAGPRRNKQMAALAGKDGALILIWDGCSKGSASMLKEAKKIGMKIFEVRV